MPLRQENACLSIGERCNANGSKKFREMQQSGDWEGCVETAREQVRDGSHAIDICTAFVGRDEIADMTEAVARMRGAINVPLAFDSTELGVLEAAFKLYGGKGVLNSINFEDGEAPAEARMKLARRFGAAVIALTIDEHGMAKEADRKVEIARRLVDFACDRHGLPFPDLMIDPLRRGEGTGSAVLLDLIERAGSRRVELDVDHDAASEAWLRRFGFELVNGDGPRRRLVRQPDTTPATV